MTVEVLTESRRRAGDAGPHLGGGPLTPGPCGFLGSLDSDGGHRWSLPLCATSGGRVDRRAATPPARATAGPKRFVTVAG
jgi:hypothetical protein